MKKLYNTKKTMTDDMVEGFTNAFPDIVKKGNNRRVVLRTNKKSDQKVNNFLF